jgi:hypothetical protein
MSEKPTVGVYPEISEYSSDTSELEVNVKAGYPDTVPKFKFIDGQGDDELVNIEMTGVGLWFDTPKEAREFGEWLIECVDHYDE